MKLIYPRLANYYLKGFISDADAADLARWDILVLATTEQVIAQVPKIRAANPDVVIMAYVGCAYTIANLPDVRDPNVWFWQGIRDAANENGWWLLRADYSHAWSWRPEYWLLNPTAGYQIWLPGYIRNELFLARPGVYDGVMLDNLWDRVSFVNAGHQSLVSLSSDGTPTPQAALDAGWHGGMSTLTTGLRVLLGNERPLVGNGPSSYPEMNGAVIEDYPRNFAGPADTGLGWRNWTLSGYPYSLLRNGAFYAAPRLNILNAGVPAWDGSYATEEDRRRFRFTLGSCLLSDAWFSFDASPATHGQLWWMPEYGYDLGAAQGPMEPVHGHGAGMFHRAFVRGEVLVNPTTKKLLNVWPMDARIG